jgi:DNA polymerase III subunit epsilon
MRQVVLDTETTGLEASQGHRIIEIGCIELIDRRLTGRHFHRYIQPDREIDSGAAGVHGITSEFLTDKPRFEEIAPELLEFIRGAELIIHNAAFDIGFIDAELAYISGGKVLEICTKLDTLELARRLHPCQRNSLEALCRRYGVDDSHRELHGALLDARILAEVYLAMTGGQTSLLLSELEESKTTQDSTGRLAAERPRLRVLKARDDELAAHAGCLQESDLASAGDCLWLRADPN